MKFAVSALTLGVASAAVCPELGQEAFNDATCKNMQNGGVDTYTPGQGCVDFNSQRKNNQVLWTMSGGAFNQWPAAVRHWCSSHGHAVKFYSDKECKELVKEDFINWGPEYTCIRDASKNIWFSEVVVDQTWINEQKEKESDQRAEHWKEVERQCKDDKKLEPECIEAWYHALDQDNGVEWLVSLGMWFNNQVWLALFGWWFSWFAGICGWYFLFFPDRLPHISDAPWEDVKPLRGMMIKAVTFTHQLMKPDAFFFTQVFTFGQSNLRDMEIIYMDPFDAVLWFFVESFLLPQQSVLAFLWVSVFWWLYLAEFTWWLVAAFFEIFISEDDDDKKGGKKDDDDDWAKE